MGLKDNKNKRQKKTRDKPFPGYFIPDETDISAEKQKARRLRASSWWRKKISTGICNYCNKKFPPGELTMDHIIPLSRGGKSERFNITASCKECNNKKKYLLPAEWEEYLEKLKK